MQVVYNSDDNYIKYAAVSIASLLENNKDEAKIDIYILENGVSSESQVRLRNMVEAYGENRSLHFISVRNLDQRLFELTGSKIDTGRFSITALARIFAPSLIPDKKRLLYLDCDTVVCKNLNKLWRLSLPDGLICGMAMEPTIYPKSKAALSFTEDEAYFNAGVILMDAEAFRRENIAALACEFMRSREGKLQFADQDVLNYILRGRVKAIPQSFNFFSGYYYRRYKDLLRLMPGFYKSGGPKAFDQARKLPSIIHFAGDERPWIAGNLSPYRKYYKQYKRLTPWADEPMIKGKRAYMLFYHLVNLCTLLSPKLRGKISEIYFNERFGKN